MTSPIETILAPPGLARDPLSEIWGDLSEADSAGLLADVRAHGVRQPSWWTWTKAPWLTAGTATGWRPWLAVSVPPLM